MAAEGYGPDLIRRFIDRFGSIEAAEDAAKAAPGYSEEIRKVESQLGLYGLIPADDPTRRLWPRLSCGRGAGIWSLRVGCVSSVPRRVGGF